MPTDSVVRPTQALEDTCLPLKLYHKVPICRLELLQWLCFRPSDCPLGTRVTLNSRRRQMEVEIIQDDIRGVYKILHK